MKTQQKFDKKSCVVFDTNTLFNSFDFANPATLMGDIRIIREFILESNHSEHIELLVPDLVLEELKMQFVERYCENISDLKRIAEKNYLPGITLLGLDCEFDIEGFASDILKRIRSHLSENQILINMKKEEASFESLLLRALNKKSPFKGKRGKSDKGFKDAVLWENILKYKTNRMDYQMVLFTKDNEFTEELKEEYFDTFNENIEIFSSHEEIMNYLRIKFSIPSEGLMTEVEVSKQIREYIGNNTKELLVQYKDWLETRKAYGPGISVAEITRLNIDNVIPARFSKYVVNGDYFAQVEIEAQGTVDDHITSFYSELFLDVSVNKENIAVQITGLTLSSMNR